MNTMVHQDISMSQKNRNPQVTLYFRILILIIPMVVIIIRAIHLKYQPLLKWGMNSCKNLCQVVKVWDLWVILCNLKYQRRMTYIISLLIPSNTEMAKNIYSLWNNITIILPITNMMSMIGSFKSMTL